MAKRNFLRETVAGFEFNAKMTTSWFTGWELYEEELEKITKLFSILSPLVEIEVDTTTGQVRVMGVPVRLSAQEFAIMDFLSERSGQLVHREELVERIWETDQGVSDQVIDTAFYRLRKKIGDQGQYIETIPGQGFCLHRAIRINEGTMARNRW